MDMITMMENVLEAMGQEQQEQEKIEKENQLQNALDRYDENSAEYRRWLIHPY